MAPPFKCNECGCHCQGRIDQTALHLHVEIENLKQRLLERENHIVSMETNFLTEVDKFPNGEFAALAEELLTWQDKYSRLYESHKRIQKVNQSLEDKLLKIVDKCETEKTHLTKDIASLKQKLVEATGNINWLKEENERNRNDVNLAIQLLQCKPSNFVSQKFESLPSDLQQKVKLYVSNKKKASDGSNQTKHEVKTIKVPIPTFPPTAMFYSVNKSNSDKDNNEKNGSGKPVDIVSAAIMAKILEEREKERQNVKHCNTCTCPAQRIYVAQGTQTELVRINCNAHEEDQSYLLDRNFMSNNNIIKVESYQTHTPTPSSAILIERSIVPVPLTTVPVPKKTDATRLNLGRNRYYSSKIGKEVNRSRKESKSELEKNDTVRHSEVSCDESGKYVRETVEPDTRGPRPCSISLQMGSSNILLDNATYYTPAFTTPRSQHALVHSSRSHSTSSSSSNDDVFNDRRMSMHTETEI